MGYGQARGHAFLFFLRQLGFGGTALLALLQESCQLSVVARRVYRQWVLCRHRAERHTHDGVGTGGKHIHTTTVNQLAIVARHLVGESKTHARALAYPVFLHQAHALRPAFQRGFVAAHLHVV